MSRTIATLIIAAVLAICLPSCQDQAVSPNPRTEDPGEGVVVALLDGKIWHSDAAWAVKGPSNALTIRASRDTAGVTQWITLSLSRVQTTGRFELSSSEGSNTAAFHDGTSLNVTIGPRQGEVVINHFSDSTIKGTFEFLAGDLANPAFYTITEGKFNLIIR